MLRKMLFVLLLLFVVSCSKPEERLGIVEKSGLGDVIYQEFPEWEDTQDLFITLDNNGKIHVVKVHDNGTIYKIEFVKEINCE